MSEMNNNYFDYLENVLGIKSLVYASMGSQDDILKTTEMLICVENYMSYQEEEIELLQKMITALKVDPAHIMICDLSDKDDYEMKVCVIFQDEPVYSTSERFLLVQTYSPRILLKKPELKKVAWNELQKVIQYFALNKTEV
jgi:hypothetical protein